MTSSPLVHLHHNHQYHRQFHPPQHSISFDQCGGELKNKLSSELLDSNSVSSSSSTSTLTTTNYNPEIKESFTKKLNRYLFLLNLFINKIKLIQFTVRNKAHTAIYN
jgi:hypothetical protein